MIPQIRILMICILFLWGILVPISGSAFRKVALGAEVPNAQLKSINGKKQKLFISDAKVNLFVFFRPNQQYSQTTLTMLSRICRSYEKRSVHCIAIVSDYYKKAKISAAIQAAGWAAERTFVDKEDLYSDQLGVILYPSVGIADGSQKLQAYEPFVKVNYAQRIEAQVRFVLGDISEKQMQNALAPPLDEDETRKSDTARVNYNLAKKLYDLRKFNKAYHQAERALHLDPKLADAHALIGLIRSKQDRCEEAKLQFQKALELDKRNEQAIKGMAKCK